MRTPNTPGPHPAVGNSYAPSVPISVYRELAAELQNAKAKMESLNAQNQQLTRQNQQLRQEIDRVVQAALSLQQMAGGTSSDRPGKPSESSYSPDVTAEAVRSIPRPVAIRTAKPGPAPASDSGPVIKTRPADPFLMSEELFTEQDDLRQRRLVQPPASDSSKDLGGVWLILIVAVIIITAFGAGFLVVRPLLPNR